MLLVVVSMLVTILSLVKGAWGCYVLSSLAMFISLLILDATGSKEGGGDGFA